MSSIQYVNSIEQLKPFLNNKGVLEIVTRNQGRQYAPFVNVALDNTQSEQRELAEKAFNQVREATRGSQIDLELTAARVQALSGIGYANLILNAANLSATCAGFMVIYNEIQQVSNDINSRLNQLDETVRKSFDIDHKRRFNKVLANHNDMLDSIRRQQPYTEREMRELVDDEHRMIELLLNTLKADVSNDQGSLIALLFTMLGMFTVSLCNYDELYYYNNPQIHNQPNPWHISHNSWMSTYEEMSSEWFIEKLQDYGVLELGLRTWEADELYCSMLLQVIEEKEKVEDNQALIVAFETKEIMQRYKELAEKDIVDTIRKAYREAGAGMDKAEVEKACEETLQKAALA